MNDNHFIKKFRNKTDIELKYILENKEKYTENAIEASNYILNERSGKPIEIKSITKKRIDKKEEKKITWKKIEKERQRSWEKNYYAGRLLWFGIACIGCAFYFFAPTLFTSEKSLIKTSGNIENVKAFYTQVSSKGHKSIKSELFLKIENDQRNYKLAKNIGQSRNNEKYEFIEKELKKSGKVNVWIKKSQQSNIEPEVFQITTGENKVLYDMDDVKSELKFLFPFLLLIGIFGIGVYVNHKYPNRIKNIMKKKPTHNTG
ncbi:hypothetical protein [Wenyingzhuangia sp. IMCC45467]